MGVRALESDKVLRSHPDPRTFLEVPDPKNSDVHKGVSGLIDYTQDT